MKIKHFAGYGCVNAKVINKMLKSSIRPYYVVDIDVSGNHEYGLLRPFHDESCIKSWLGRFAPKGFEVSDYDVLDDGYRKQDGLDTEYAIYRLVCKEV